MVLDGPLNDRMELYLTADYKEWLAKLLQKMIRSRNGYRIEFNGIFPSCRSPWNKEIYSGFAYYFQWFLSKIIDRFDDEILPVFFKHFTFEQHRFEALAF